MEPVVFEVQGRVGVARLNSEATLNSLTLEMIDALTARLDAWELDANIAAIWICGAGEKAFCAGGDIRRLHGAIASNRHEGAEQFFEREYKLDSRIHTYPKPVIIWGHGIVMGGGLGIMAGCAFRIATEATKMAMPEITIGLYPDVGGSYFLSRMPEGIGMFLGLTGARLNGADALFCGLANAFVKRELRDEFFGELAKLEWTTCAKKNKGLINASLRKFEARSVEARPAAELEKRAGLLREIATLADLDAFESWLKERAATDAWLQPALKSFTSGSPTSARVIWKQLREARGLTLHEAFARDMALSTQFAHHHDLAEGIRALLIDKDNQPKWQPASRREVSDALVDEHFAWRHLHPNPLDRTR